MNSTLSSLGLIATSRQFWARLAPLVLLTMLWSGCVTHRVITANSQYPTDYVIGKVYQTKQILVAERVEQHIFRGYDTFMPFPVDMEPRVSVVQAQPETFAPEYVLVPVNTFVRIERFDLEYNMENGHMVWILGRALGGPLAGQELNLSLISREEGRSALVAQLLMVDTNYLERIENQ